MTAYGQLQTVRHSRELYRFWLDEGVPNLHPPHPAVEFTPFSEMTDTSVYDPRHGFRAANGWTKAEKRAYARTYYAENRERCQQASRDYYKKNAEHASYRSRLKYWERKLGVVAA